MRTDNPCNTYCPKLSESSGSVRRYSSHHANLRFFEQLTGTAAEACLAVNRDLSLGAWLPRTSARLKSSDRLSIVAVGSSSTVGLWVLRSGATYPEVMRQELVRLLLRANLRGGTLHPQFFGSVYVSLRTSARRTRS